MALSTLPTEMKAIRFNRYGSNEVLELVKNQGLPRLKPNDVLLKVHAAALNPVDWKIRSGHLSIVTGSNFPKIPGFDVSGTIISIGSAVTLFKIGDEVLGMANFERCGALAEYMAIEQENITIKPPSIDFAFAASIPLVGLTIYQSLENRINQGQTILIIGAAGGTGSFAVQFAKNHLNTIVIATCSTRNIEFVSQLGANQIIDYTEKEWSTELQGRNIDLVLDCVGDADNYEKSKKILKNGGWFVTLNPNSSKAFSIGDSVKVGFDIASRKLSQWIFGQINYDFVMCKVICSQLRFIIQLATEQKLKPTIEHIYSLDQAIEAMQCIEQGRVRGKLVISIYQPTQ
eukprot:TRINITY_DN1057_c0_g1_i1.p1 TRINITY_DN1057_c0_g1~~TRINITY_DN1057_c0_g1_i1.p1  ORF type:complete len:345 (+),score=130.00 TRINITY_DN1057_c0_g1_i1:119-1153(+)